MSQVSRIAGSLDPSAEENEYKLNRSSNVLNCHFHSSND
jgi:hypothetical protein